MPTAGPFTTPTKIPIVIKYQTYVLATFLGSLVRKINIFNSGIGNLHRALEDLEFTAVTDSLASYSLV